MRDSTGLMGLEAAMGLVAAVALPMVMAVGWAMGLVAMVVVWICQ